MILYINTYSALHHENISNVDNDFESVIYNVFHFIYIKNDGNIETFE